MKRMIRIRLMMILAAVIIFASADIACALTEAPGGTAATMDELNSALGGVHEISGNTITLQDDVYLDGMVKLDRFPDEVTIDANGKSVISAKSVTDMLLAWGTDLKLTGNGSYHSLNERGHCLRGVLVGKSPSEPAYPCTLTIENGEFDLDCDKNKIVIMTYSSLDDEYRAKAVINGGKFYGGNAVTNTDYMDGDQCDIPLWGPVDVEVNGGSMDSICLYAPSRQTDDMGGTGAYGTNTLSLRTDNNADINVHEIRCFRTRLTMNGGTVNHIDAEDSSVVYIKKGLVSGKGIDVINGSRLAISGGSFHHDYGSDNDEEFILLRDSVLHKKASSWASSIKGITIYEHGGQDNQKIYHGIRRLNTICVKGKSSLTVSDVKCISKDSNRIVNSAFYLEGTKTYKPSLTFKAVKGKYIKTQKYAYSVVKSGKYGTVKLASHSLLKATKTKKKKYYAGQKLPKNIKGVMTVVYTRVKSK